MILRTLGLVLMTVSFGILASSTYGQSNCQQSTTSTALCPSGCHVSIRVFYSSPSGDCWTNAGDTIPCPGQCPGEYVYTATYLGPCLYPDGCRPGAFKLGEKLLLDARLGKVYVPDCDGNIQVVFPDSKLSDASRATRDGSSKRIDLKSL